MKIIATYMALAAGFGAICACADTPETAVFAGLSSTLGEMGFTQAETACTLESLSGSLGTEAVIGLAPAFEDMKAAAVNDGGTLPLQEQDRLVVAMSVGSYKALMVFGAGDAKAIADGIAAGTKLQADCDSEFSDDGEE